MGNLNFNYFCKKILGMELKENTKEKISALEKLADATTRWVGSISSVIAHTIFFILCFAVVILDIVDLDKMLLVLTTVVSLEAIYLAIFIQMAVNKSSEHIEDLKEDIEDIQEDIEDISEDIDEISEDIEDIQEDIEEINEEEDDDDPSERARNTMLRSNVSTNKTEIKALKKIIADLQKQVDELKEEE